MRRLAPWILLIAVSCAQDRPSRDTQQPRASEPRLATAERTEPANDAGCPVDSSGRHGDPLQLVREWTDRDNRGGTLTPGPWYFGALACDETATSDMIYVTSPITITLLSASADTALVLATYHRFFEVGYDSAGVAMQLHPVPAEVAETTRVVRLPGLGWRIDAIRGGAHLLPHVALDSLARLDSASKEALRGLTTRPDV
jgi:hypothetical protein